jgi:hypothetical protein
VDAGYRGRAAPCQRERSDRALDWVTATDNQSLRRFPDTRRCPPFGLLAEAVPRQPRAGDRPVSGARPAPWTYSREHRDTWSRQTAAAPPQPAQPLSRKTLNRPLCFYVRPSRPSCAFRGPHTAMCHGAPGHERVSRDLYFWTGRTNPPSAQIRGRGPELPLNRHGHVVERLLGLDAIAPSPGC